MDFAVTSGMRSTDLHRSAIDHTAATVDYEAYKQHFLSTAALFTFGNPHVYLDTVVLIGTMAMKFVPFERMLFAAGAALASFVFFFSLAYGARLLAPRMKNQMTWKILDLMIAVIMFLLALGMLIAGGWFN